MTFSTHSRCDFSISTPSDFQALSVATRFVSESRMDCGCHCRMSQTVNLSPIEIWKIFLNYLFR